MVAGTYKLDKNENLAAYLKALGISDEIAKKADAAGLTVDVTVEGNKYSFISSSGLNLSFVLNEEFDEPLPIPGVMLKTTGKKVNDKKIVLNSTAADGRTGTRTYEFSDAGFVLTLVSDNVTAKRHYSKA